jgi:hypothetical protein
MFVATWYDSGKSSPFPQPRFIPSRQFRQQTTAMCPKDRAIVNADAATTYRRSHHPSSKPDRAASFVSSAMFALRDQWKHQPACPIG